MIIIRSTDFPVPGSFFFFFFYFLVIYQRDLYIITLNNCFLLHEFLLNSCYPAQITTDSFLLLVSPTKKNQKMFPGPH